MAAVLAGVDAGERLIQDQRQRVEVGLRADLTAVGLLGRHVGERADDVAGARQGGAADHVGNAEVGQLGAVVREPGRTVGTSTFEGLTSRWMTPWPWA